MKTLMLGVILLTGCVLTGCDVFERPTQACGTPENVSLWDGKSWHPYYSSAPARCWQDLVETEPDRIRALVESYTTDTHLIPSGWSADRWLQMRTLLALQVANPHDLKLQRVTLLLARKLQRDDGLTQPMLGILQDELPKISDRDKDWDLIGADQLSRELWDVCNKYGLPCSSKRPKVNDELLEAPKQTT